MSPPSSKAAASSRLKGRRDRRLLWYGLRASAHRRKTPSAYACSCQRACSKPLRRGRRQDGWRIAATLQAAGTLIGRCKSDDRGPGARVGAIRHRANVGESARVSGLQRQDGRQKREATGRGASVDYDPSLPMGKRWRDVHDLSGAGMPDMSAGQGRTEDNRDVAL